MTKVSFQSLWLYLIGWVSPDLYSVAIGSHVDLKEDYAIGFFILMVWLGERFIFPGLWALLQKSGDGR